MSLHQQFITNNLCLLKLLYSFLTEMHAQVCLKSKWEFPTHFYEEYMYRINIFINCHFDEAY